MKTYSSSGDRNVIGYVFGKHGQYEVFYRNSKDPYFKNTSTTVLTKFRVNSDGNYVAPDGTVYTNNPSVIAAIQNCYDLGRYK